MAGTQIQKLFEYQVRYKAVELASAEQAMTPKQITILNQTQAIFFWHVSMPNHRNLQS